MTHSANEDDDTPRPAPHADDELSAAPRFDEPPQFVAQPPQFAAQPPLYGEAPQFTETPQFAEPPQFAAQPPPYTQVSQFAEPPQFAAQPPLYSEAPQFTEPPQYDRRPPQSTYPPTAYGEPAHATEPGTPSGPAAETTGPRSRLQPPPQPPAQPLPPQPLPPQQPPFQQVPQHAYGPGPSSFGSPAPVPRPEDLLVSTASAVTDEPAGWGWRGKVNRGSGGMFKVRPAEAELAARRAIVGIQRSFSRPMTVVVIQPKGGAGKTPTTICLSAAFGAHRGGYVVGWDDNETRGTLAVRVANPDNQQATVWDLLSDLPAFERSDARVGDLGHYVRAQPDAHFDALVSDDSPGNMAQIGEDEFQRLHRVLQRFYRMIVIDTGNNVRSANWQAAVNAADLVVVVSTYQRDVGYSASWVLDHLAQTGREDLARNAVSILTAAEPTSDKQVRDQLLAHFAARTRAVVQIPYDKELAHGGPISWTALAPQTRTAWVQAGATIADALAEQDERAMAARRS